MSNESKRSSQDIHTEYVRLCMRAGELQYKIGELDKELSMMNSTIRDLNLEYGAAIKAEEEAKKEAAAKEPVKKEGE